MKWGVLGANGFIGARMIEKLYLGGEDVRPIVRQASSLARVARFNMDWKIAAQSNPAALTEAMKGCDVLVHLAVSDASVTVKGVPAFYSAAQRAGVKRIVYMSSAAVHGLSPEPGTNEETPLPQNERIGYYQMKIQAEDAWRKARRVGSVELTGIRPGIVFGPRSFWCADVIERARLGTLYLAGKGQGICNSIYVDNLIQAVVLAGKAPGVDNEFFLVRDREEVTWNDFYGPLLRSCGFNLDDVPLVETPSSFPMEKDQKLFNRLRQVPLIKRTIKSTPAVMRRIGKSVIKGLPAPYEVSRWKSPERPTLQLSEEMVGLQNSRWRIPYAKAERMLGYQPEVPFAEGLRRSVGWLQFAGYPCNPARM